MDDRQHTGCPASTSTSREWDASGQNYETLAICRTLGLARAAFKIAIAEKLLAAS
jgi:hypothetical protein